MRALIFLQFYIFIMQFFHYNTSILQKIVKQQMEIKSPNTYDLVWKILDFHFEKLATLAVIQPTSRFSNSEFFRNQFHMFLNGKFEKTVVRIGFNYRKIKDPKSWNSFRDSARGYIIYLTDTKSIIEVLYTMDTLKIPWNFDTRFFVICEAECKRKNLFLGSNSRRPFSILSVLPMIVVVDVNEDVIYEICTPSNKTLKISISATNNLTQVTTLTSRFTKLCQPNFRNATLPVSLIEYHSVTELKENVSKKLGSNASDDILLTDLNSYDGPETLFLKSLMKRFNFQIKVFYNCTWIECIHKIFEEKVLIAGNKIGIHELTNENSEFTITVGYDKLCLVIGEDMLPRFRTDFLDNSRLNFLALEGIVFITIVIIWLCILKWSRGFQFWENLGSVCLATWSLINGGSFDKKFIVLSEHILIGIFLLCNVVILNGFQSVLTDIMHERYEKDTFKSWDEVMKSGIQIKLQSPFTMKTILLKSHHSDIKDIMQKIITEQNNESDELILNFEKIVSQGFAILSSYGVASYYVSRSTTRNNGKTPLIMLENVMPEMQRPLAYVIDKRLKILPNINRHTGDLLHSGLFLKWCDDFKEQYPKIPQQMSKKHKTQINLFLNDLHSLFLFQIYGTLISIIVFVAEVVVYFLINRKFPCVNRRKKKIKKILVRERSNNS